MRKQCLNFLIDMLNDEIDEVRIGALHGISGFNEILALNVSILQKTFDFIRMKKLTVFSLTSMKTTNA